MAIFVVGFALDFDAKHVLMVRKTHPSWQVGRLNGLGGKVESGETPIAAMVREFKEETKGRFVGSLLYRPTGWRHVITLTGADWQCLVFSGRLNAIDMKNAPRFNDEEEPIESHPIADLWQHKCVTNALWMIPFCLSASIEYHPDALPLVLPEACTGAVRAAAGAF